MSEPDLEALARAALAARDAAYAPYSRFLVGAAALGEDGRTYRGANVENASYGLTICAERNAVIQAVLGGARRIVALAVASETAPPAAPCGVCRQTLAEFAGDDLPILLLNPTGARRLLRLGALLPFAFRPEDLGVTP